LNPFGKKLAMRLLKLAVAVALLAGLYSAADWRQVGNMLAALDGRWLIASLFLFAPQTALSALRWRRLMAPVVAISYAESLRQTLGASALNLVIPSKLGDLSKAAMLPLSSAADRARASGLAVAEKGADVAALALLWAAGAADLGGLGLIAILALLTAFIYGRRLRNSPYYAPAIASLLLWSLHLLQIDCFMKAAGVFVSWSEATSRLPAAIFAGLLPISFCGIGTRDSTLVWLFSDSAPASAMAVVGLLTALRYLLPGVLGIPCLLRGAAAQRSGATLRSAVSSAPAMR
jgi:glycosyltransferase 2 family protein